MAVDIKSRNADGTITLSGTANTVTAVRVYCARDITFQSSVAFEVHYGEDDAASVSAGEGKAIAAGAAWTVPCDFQAQALDGYFEVGLSSASTSAEIEWVAESRQS